MPIDDIKPSEAIKPYCGNPGQSGKHSGRHDFSEKRKYPPGKRSLDDVTSFMNIPQDELTPAVTEAIISLMEEVDQLRTELTMIQLFDEKLSSTLDSHLDLPVLTRHALCREVGVIAARLERTETQATFVYFQFSNFAEIKKRAGLLAGEAVIREAAEILKDQLRATDRIGTLGGDGFGILMALSDEVSAERKVMQLVDMVQQGPIIHEGHTIEVEVAYGLHTLHASEPVETVLAAADADLHRRFIRL